jgi:hypothetical protein
MLEGRQAVEGALLLGWAAAFLAGQPLKERVVLEKAWLRS